MGGVWRKMLIGCGIEPRSWRALVAVFTLMDLRAQHFAQATATRPNYLISPLFWVMGQCLTLSAVTSLLLFARVDVFFFAFVGLGLSWLMTAVLLVVEFDEVVLAPRDWEVLAPRPVAPRTLAAARLANLLLYIGLGWLAMNIFPAIVGAGLRDAGWLYLPAYLLASAAGTCVIVAMVVMLSALGRGRPGFETLKNVLAWTQIVLILVVGYGGQFMLRDDSFTVQTWAAYPPDWLAWLPPTWLARYVEQTALGGDNSTLTTSAILAATALAALMMTLAVLSATSPLAVAARRRPGGAVASAHPATLASRPWSWLLRSPEERAGFWLCRLMLRRDAGLWMRCLLPFHLPFALLLLALLLNWTELGAGAGAAGGFGGINGSAVLALGSVYALAAAVAIAVYHLATCRDFGGGWLLRGVAEPAARGAAKALVVSVALPCVVLLGVGWTLYGDALTGLGLLALALCLCWPAALAGLWLLLPAPPFTLSPVRGATFGLPPLPLAGITLILGTLAAAHVQWGSSPWFWGTLALGAVACVAPLSRLARRRLRRMDRPG